MIYALKIGHYRLTTISTSNISIGLEIIFLRLRIIVTAAVCTATTATVYNYLHVIQSHSIPTVGSLQNMSVTGKKQDDTTISRVFVGRHQVSGTLPNLRLFPTYYYFSFGYRLGRSHAFVFFALDLLTTTTIIICVAIRYARAHAHRQ